MSAVIEETNNYGRFDVKARFGEGHQQSIPDLFVQTTFSSSLVGYHSSVS